MTLDQWKSALWSDDSKFYQHSSYATKGETCFYSKAQKGYRSIPQLHLGLSNHVSIPLIPACNLIRKRVPSAGKTENMARGCTASVAVLFREHIWRPGRASVLCFTNFCVDNVTVEKHIVVYSIQKPGMTEEVQAHAETT